MRWVTEAVLNFIWPPFCTHCLRLGTLLCSNCYEQHLHFFTLPVELDLQPNYLDAVQAAVAYEGAARSLVRAMKYQSVYNCGLVCARLIYHTVNLPTVDCVTAVPISRQRQRERGFNQAAIIGRELARLLGVPYHELLVRQKHTRHQASITSREERLNHLQDAFALNPAIRAGPATVLLVDDVVTTGTTLNSCAQVLKENRVQKVFAVTVAHGH